MNNPAQAARRVLFGAGIGLLLVAFLSLREERLPLGVNIGWSIVVTAIVMIIIAALIPLDAEGEGILARLFPAKDDALTGVDVQMEIDAETKYEDTGGAWAQLEEAMLSASLDESE